MKSATRSGWSSVPSVRGCNSSGEGSDRGDEREVEPHIPGPRRGTRPGTMSENQGTNKGRNPYQSLRAPWGAHLCVYTEGPRDGPGESRTYRREGEKWNKYRVLKDQVLTGPGPSSAGEGVQVVRPSQLRPLIFRDGETAPVDTDVPVVECPAPCHTHGGPPRSTPREPRSRTLYPSRPPSPLGPETRQQEPVRGRDRRSRAWDGAGLPVIEGLPTLLCHCTGGEDVTESLVRPRTPTGPYMVGCGSRVQSPTRDREPGPRR